MSQIKNLGEALTVLVQVAELAQSRGILSFDDAVVTKSAIDFINELSKQVKEAEGQEELESVTNEANAEEKVIRRKGGPKA